MRNPILTSAVAAFALALAAAPALARADLSRKVITSFKGQIVVSDGDLSQGASDKATIADIKKAKIATITGTSIGEDVTGWQFHYTAFPKLAGASELRLEFHKKDAAARLVADKTISGVDKKAMVLSGDISISEDEGLAKGQTYTVQLTGQVNGASKVFASTDLTMK